MCGICGWLSPGRKLDSKVFMNMNNIAKYRGPDDEGYMSISEKRAVKLSGDDSCRELTYDGDIHQYSPKSDDSFLMLGHRRLAIIDLSPDGHQPMRKPDDSIYITFNGEIYNYIEIREELKSLGHSFSTQTDTEVIVEAYKEWGEHCVQHFNGMWGFAIWDEKRHALFCSRDRLGAKPLYFCTTGGEFIFASEIKQICQNPYVKRVLNKRVFVSQIIWGITDYSEETLIQDIQSLPGGYNIHVQLDDDNRVIEKITKVQYWDIDVDKKDSVAKKRAFEVFEDAVRLRLRSDVPVGVLLSGGLDSSCLVAEIADQYKKSGISTNNLNTFTSCYNEFEEGNEQDFARTVNEHCGTTQNFIFPDENDTLSIYEDIVWHLEGGAGIQVIGSYLTLQEISKTGVKVLLNGQGSDESQFGYERYYAYYFKDLLKNGHLCEFLRAFHDGKENSRLSAKLMAEYMVYFSTLSIRKSRCFNRMSKYITATTATAFRKDKTVNRCLKIRNMRELQYNELRGAQLAHILRMDDRLYMACSLESRVPYIDYRYVEEAVQIQEKEKIQNGYTKFLLRDRYKDMLPENVIWRKNKMGWPSPKKRWAERFDDARMSDMFQHARTGKYFNVDELQKLYQESPDAYPVEQFLTAEIFVRRFDVEV